MQIRSSSRLVNNPSSNPTPSTNLNPKGRNHRRLKQRIEEFNLEELSPPIVTMADQRTMAQLLQAPTEGYEDAIVVPTITANNFELKHGLLTLVQNKQFFGHDKEDPHAHIRYFTKITSTLKFSNVPNAEAWDRFKDLLRTCPHHGFSKLHQPNTLYNALNSKDQDSLNSAAGVVAKLSMNTSTSGISTDVAELKDMVKALLLDKKSQNQAPATVKAVEESCVTCGGAHSYRNCPATDGNIYRVNIQEFVSQASAVNYNQGNTSYLPPMMSNQIRPPGFPLFVNSNGASTSSSGTPPRNTIANPRSDLKAITTQSGVSYDGPQILPPPSFLPKVVENEPDATKDTVHPTNNESTKDVQPQVVPTQSPILTSEPVNSPTIEPVSAPRPNLRPSVPYPSRLQDQKLRDKANDQREKFFQIFKDLNFNISFADALILMPKFGPSIKSLLTNKDKLCELARTLLNEHYLAVLLKKLLEKLGDPGKRALIDVFEGELTLHVGKEEVLDYSDMITNGNPTPYYDPIVSTTSLTLSPFGNIDFLLEEVDAFLALEDDPSSPKVDQSYLDSEGDILLLEAYLNDDPSLPPPNQGNYLPEVRKELKIREAKSDKSSIDELFLLLTPLYHEKLSLKP
uniref:Reverse transcriptase domain-containing protein n=1 Tax=Tanacetum cinerariifolium TaxID=118510 RepID=A0A6L2MED3_TANCI|nr:reverse transcriptase domain-containing protein [Tanacetum cinerariifolium]